MTGNVEIPGAGLRERKKNAVGRKKTICGLEPWPHGGKASARPGGGAEVEKEKVYRTMLADKEAVGSEAGRNGASHVL